MLLLNRSETSQLASLPACIEAVEEAFRRHALPGGSLGYARVHLSGILGGQFHLTAGGYTTGESTGAVGLKLNGRFPPETEGGPQRVSGAVLLSDAATGKPVALMDSMVVTGLRTAAVTAVVARRLARANATTALLVGAGKQAPGQLEALRASTAVTELAIFDVHAPSADRLVAFARTLGYSARVVDDPAAAAIISDVVVTVTPARSPILQAGDIKEGALVVALGADAPGKQELDPAILTNARVVVDLLDQAAESGELQHALRSGMLKRDDVHAELADVIAGIRPGRTAEKETFVFDGTGTALQDIAAATTLLTEARRLSRGTEFNLEA